MIKKLVLSLLIVASATTVMPIGVAAEWKNNNTGWWYTEGDSYSTGWKQIDGSWYYFGNDGYMKRGWILDKAEWYYLQDNGIMATGKLAIKDRVYELDINGKWIYNSSSNETTSTIISTPPSEDKLRLIPNFSWFNENSNTYFKLMNTLYAKDGWNIDGYVYAFDENGVMQKGEYTTPDGIKFLLGNDGRIIKCITDESYKVWDGCAITTKSSTDNYVVKLDDSHMMDITGVYSKDPTKNQAKIKSETGYYLDTTQPKAAVEGKTLYCKTNQTIHLGTIKVIGADSESSSFPNLIIRSDSTDRNILFFGVDLSLEDGFYRNIHPTIIAHNIGKTTITINVNGTKTLFDVVVTE